MKSNFHAVFTDCPHREKLGWLEQVHLNGPGLFYNFNLTTFAPKIMRIFAMHNFQTVWFLILLLNTSSLKVIQDSPEWEAPLSFYLSCTINITEIIR